MNDLTEDEKRRNTFLFFSSKSVFLLNRVRHGWGIWHLVKCIALMHDFRLHPTGPRSKVLRGMLPALFVKGLFLLWVSTRALPVQQWGWPLMFTAMWPHNRFLRGLPDIYCQGSMLRIMALGSAYMLNAQITCTLRHGSHSPVMQTHSPLQCGQIPVPW